MRIIVALAIFSQWSGNGPVTFYLYKVFNQIGITNPNTQLLLNGLLQLWNLFWAVLAATLVNRLGRRFLFLASAGLMMLFYTAQTVCLAQYSEYSVPAAGHAFVVFVFLFFAAYDIAFTPLIISYTVEILPFHLRSKGFAVFGVVIFLAVIFNQYINPFALDALGWKYYVSPLYASVSCQTHAKCSWSTSAGWRSSSCSCGSSSSRPRIEHWKRLLLFLMAKGPSKRYAHRKGTCKVL